MATTTYAVQVNGETVETKTSKPAAIKVAEQVRAAQMTGVTVVTGKGTVVLELAAPKGKRLIRHMSKPFTRVETHAKAANVEAPDGYVLAYLRTRLGLAVFRGEDRDWLVQNLATGATQEVESTREAQKLIAAIAKGKAQL